MHLSRPTFLAAGLLALACSAGAAPAAPASADAGDTLSLERLFADPPLLGRQGAGGTLSPGGRWLSYLRPSDSNPDINELWARPLPSGEPRRLVSTSDLIGQREARLTEAEKMALERRRQRGLGITSYIWCGKDDQRLIVPLAGDLYQVDLGEAGPAVTRLTFDEQEPEREPQCDGAGARVAYVKRNDLWVQGLGEGASKPLQLTHSGNETRSTGLAEFIAEEELSRHRGFWWAPDGKRLLAIEVDESGVPVRMRPEIGGDGTHSTPQHYPGAGQPNARLRALVLDAQGQQAPQHLVLAAEAEYIARAGWFADGSPWLQWLSRDQKHLALWEFPAGKARSVLDERDAAWVELHEDLRELPWLQRSGKPALLWSSERSGRRQFWLIDRVSGAAEMLTHQPEPVAHLVCLNEQRLVFAGATERGRGRELFETDFKGRTQLLQPGTAQRWREARGDAECRQLLVTESSWQTPAHTDLYALDGRTPPREVEAARPEPLLLSLIPQVQPQALKLLAADGRTELNGFYIPAARPGAAPGSVPVIVRAYGGPGTATVSWRWPGDLAQLALYQRQGFAQLLIDTRGMENRDRDFTRAHYLSFGKVEVEDLFTAVRQMLQQRPELDPRRVGFTGWSYGGFLAVRSMLDADTPFAAAIAGAPPTDWTLYDTAYTERYLGMPEGGKAAAYQQANLVLRAALLSKPLMLMHGTADDNVFFDNSLRLIQALQNEGKLFETVIYPGHAHGVAGRKARYHVARTQLDFFVRQLKP